MEEEASPRRSVAELAGRFKDSAPAGNQADKPVRRRPPRTLQLPETHADQQGSPAAVTSPLPTKAKRNSALIEKLQANLALSPVATPPKSPGFRLLPPAFGPPPAPASPAPTPSPATPGSPIDASPLTEEEGPASFEAPPTAAEGCVLLSINKGRIRHSVRRRPPSRRHRKSSAGNDDDVAKDDTDTGGGDETPTLHVNKAAGEKMQENADEDEGGGASWKQEEGEGDAGQDESEEALSSTR